MGKSDKPVKSNKDFWDWFEENESTFHKVLKNQDNIENNFFDKLSPKLNELKEGYWFLAGMYDDDTAELVLTADGIIKNIAFVEELVAVAPKINGWKFTALKPATDIKNVNIQMEEFEFSKEKLSFYSNDDPEYPDEVSITLVHEDYNENNEVPISNGSYLFIDNFLGELNSVMDIDIIQIAGKTQAEKELVPIEKLKDFLVWRQKEFIEKHERTEYDTSNDAYSSFQATLNNGKPLVAIINTTLLEWELKASHPWILNIAINYPGDENGLPDKTSLDLMEEIEDNVKTKLKSKEGYLHIGRQTAESVREISFACRDFREPSKVLHEIKNEYKDRINLDFEIYKDKYWRSFDQFRRAVS